MQKRALEEAEELQSNALDSFKRLALYQYSAGDYSASLETLHRAADRFPGDLEIAENRGVMHRLTGQLPKAIECLEEVYERDSARANVCDALAHSYASLGNTERAIFFGRRSLELKDVQACSKARVWKLPADGPETFSHEDVSRNVISFSLWGNNPRYTNGALRNAVAAIDVYPGWSCRFYIDDSVPGRVVRQLESLGAQILRKNRPATFFDGLLWRFEVISDPSVSRFLIRDCDSVVNVKERVAVDEWLDSGRWFHAMRDFYSHTELLLAGMWGGATGVFPDLVDVRKTFRPATAPTRTYDQLFLRECFWPTVKQSVLIHDSIFTGTLGSVSFPAVGGLPPRFHVGQNEAAVRPDVPLPIPEDHEASRANIVILSGIDERAIEFAGDALSNATGLVFVSSQRMNSIRESAVCLSEVLQRFLGEHENSLRDSAEKLIENSLRVLASDADSVSVDCVAIADQAETAESLNRLAKMPGVKILGVIRDPRDTASDRRLPNPEECGEVAKQWNTHVGKLSKIHGENPGKVEIVRYEDLSPSRARKTLNRLARFLALENTKSVQVPLDAVDSGKPLPVEMKRVIEEITRASLKKLRYSISD